jgi:outer membrane murein-binding lipoprotein Lpp
MFFSADNAGPGTGKAILWQHTKGVSLTSDERGTRVMTRLSIRFVGTALCLTLGMSLAGCDYWPPALQVQIEQLRSEIQTLSMEKSQLQAQVNDLSNVKGDLLAKVDDLSRLNRDKSGMITSLQNQLDATRARYMKAISPKAPAHKSPAKLTAKPTTRPTFKSTVPAPMHKRPSPNVLGVR